MREIMKIMGLSDTAHHLSWFATGFILFFWIALSSAIISKLSFFPASDFGFLVLFYLLYCISVLNFCFVVSVFFANAKLAAMVGPIVYFGTVLPKYVFFGTNSNEAVTSKFLSSLLSPTAFAFGLDIFSNYEYSKVGVQWSNYQDGDFNMKGILTMLAIDIIVYGLLAWYLDQIISHDYGISRHPLFFLSMQYWKPFLNLFRIKRESALAPNSEEDFDPQYLIKHKKLKTLPKEIPLNYADYIVFDTFEDIPSSKLDMGAVYEVPRHQHSDHWLGSNKTTNIDNFREQKPPIGGYGYTPPTRSTNIQQESINSPPATLVPLLNENIEQLSLNIVADVKVIANDLYKVYRNGKKAVNGFSMAMLRDQITCLLGHNGAGKSTVIGMLTGLHTMTSGECSIFGHLMPQELAEIRQLTGICPQQNVLFASLTVKEHLIFFGSIKGLIGKNLINEVTEIIHDVGLSDKTHTPSAALSGGMKRKLQLAIALIGKSKFIMLDEPTSGMDPYSRRATWELLQRKRAGRVIVLTTHFMEEAGK